MLAFGARGRWVSHGVHADVSYILGICLIHLVCVLIVYEDEVDEVGGSTDEICRFDQRTVYLGDGHSLLSFAHPYVSADRRAGRMSEVPTSTKRDRHTNRSCTDHVSSSYEVPD
jgi:hypothetical protein